jgi:hypothetical protein
MLPPPHPPHRNFRTLQHPLLDAHPLPAPLPHHHRIHYIPIRGVELKRLDRPPDPENAIRIQGYEVRDREEEGVSVYAWTGWVGILRGLEGKRMRRRRESWGRG